MRVIDRTVKFRVTFAPGFRSLESTWIVPFTSLIVNECCIVSLLWNVTMSLIGTSGTKMRFRANCCLVPFVSPTTVTLNVGVGTVWAATGGTKAEKPATTHKHVTMMSAKLLIPRPSGCRSHLEIPGKRENERFLFIRCAVVHFSP